MVELPKDLAKALYNALLNPQKDRDGHTVYVVSLFLASEIRAAIGDKI